jgi:hypothetical protein
MKKLIGIALMLVSMGFVASSEAKASGSANGNTTVNAAPQWQRGRNGRRYARRPVRLVTRTRVVKVGRRVYRETYQVRYLSNGATDTHVISRVRIS